MQNWFHVPRMKISSGNLGKNLESVWNMRQWIEHTWSPGLRQKLPIKREPCIWKWKQSCGNGAGRVTLLEQLMNWLSTQNSLFFVTTLCKNKRFHLEFIDWDVFFRPDNRQKSNRKDPCWHAWERNKCVNDLKALITIIVYHYRSSSSRTGHAKHPCMCVCMCICIFFSSSTLCVSGFLKVTGNCCQICSLRTHKDKIITTIAIFKNARHLWSLVTCSSWTIAADGWLL